ncbi:MAG: PQQ-binding-like beta-propeller repeat protein, partial [Alphaproteobacteria bacterium]
MEFESRTRRRWALLLCGAIALVPGVARAWRTSLPGLGRARAVVVSKGRVVAAGEVGAVGATTFSVASFDELTGQLAWRKDVAPGSATGIQVDAAGDFLVGGLIGDKDGAGVVKLDDATGNEIWRYRVPRSLVFPGRSVAFGRALNGDAVLAIGRTSVGSDKIRTMVYRLASSNGQIVWRKNLGRRVAVALAIDSKGDVLVAGAEKTGNPSSGAPGPKDPVKILKLDRATGNVVWGAYPGLRADDVRLVVTSDDQVAVAGRADLDAPAVAALLGRLDGAQKWRAGLGQGGAVSLAPAAEGDVAAALNLPGPVLGTQASRLAASDGAARWSRTIASGSGEPCGTSAFFVGASGGPVLGGCVASAPATGFRFELTGLDGKTGVIRWQRGIDGLAPDAVTDSVPVLAIADAGSGNLAAVGATADAVVAPAFTVVEWNDERGDDLLDPADRRCRGTIVSAGRNYVFTRLQFIESCFDSINAGTLDLAFDECMLDPGVKTKVERLATRTVNSIRSDCAGPELPEGVSCGATLHELLEEPKTSGQVGCLLDSDDDVGNEVAAAAYRKVLAGQPSGVRSCQTAIGTSGR